MDQKHPPETRLPDPCMIALPADLAAAVEQALASTSKSRWIREAQSLSARYRSKARDTATPLASGQEQALGYAALILPATYAQLRGACAAVLARIPTWEPTTLLDLGSGPGTALWAATYQWPSLKTLTAWERQKEFIVLGRQLAAQAHNAAVRNTTWRQIDLTRSSLAAPQRYDLVVLGHVLNELDAAEQAAVVEAAWLLTGGVLLIVEPGTSTAFQVVRMARDQLLTQGGYTIAPCAHDQPCPLQNDWCHFPQRLKRPAFQRQARGAPSDWEDAKFSYAAIARFPPTHPIWGRVIRETKSNKAYAETQISSRSGIELYRGLKRHREAFRAVRDLEWGHALDQPPQMATIEVVPQFPLDHQKPHDDGLDP